MRIEYNYVFSQELANENKLLKSLQKRQDSALKRYEGTNAELPRIINTHHEELRVLHIKYKKLKALQKETCDLLKEKENELQQLQAQNKHLLQLSKDRNLGEREKLQLQVSDLNHKIQQQQDTIQTLHRKLNLETKSLKQQLQSEISKRKETQKNLDDATEKLKGLENLLDNRERRLYYNDQLFPEKNRRFGTRSLTNLRDISSSNPLKLPDKDKKWQTEIQEDKLPLLRTPDAESKSMNTEEKVNLSQTLDGLKTETMANLEQVRKYRLQKSPYRKIDNAGETSKELDLETKEASDTSTALGDSLREKEGEDAQKYEITANKFRKLYENRKYENFDTSLEKELVYSSGGSESENENFKDSYKIAKKNSKQMRVRLISSADDTSDSKELTFSDSKYEDKLKVLVGERTNSYESDSEVETEARKQSIKHYLEVDHQLISSAYDNQSHYNSDKEVEKLTSSRNILSGSQRLYQNLVNEMLAQSKNVENDIYVQHDVESSQPEYKNSANLGKNIFKRTVHVTQEYNDTTEYDLGNESLQTYSKDEHSNGQLVVDESIENHNLEARNKLNKQELNKQSESIDVLSVRSQPTDNTGNGSVQSRLNNVNSTSEINIKTKKTNYNKEKLLASMKAIDDNENIEFLNQDYDRHNVTSRKQVKDNELNNLPIHMKRKQDIIKDIFDNDVIKNESADSYNKLH
ncbi:hyaluronan mediated motility receptor isoform X2 [Ceratina calcarata]|uniref:Hyaluronan mediated motility receptor isoform X2 n=1 Tax=Ceratina calcarata TaxID=156304 RepID=A0AAJ7RXR4_9HYME|nr:hyaluronan mediated motility receptor isoform X2 [Ceratina calcarata]